MRRQVKAPEVQRELVAGQSTALLKELHLLTREGDLNADSLRKLKQVNHRVRQLAPAVEDVLSRFGDPVVVDCGAGKGYLGFILHELFVGPAAKGTIVSVESRPEVVPCCQAEVARQLERAKDASPLLAPLHEHAWHRREFGSHLTNVIRALALEAHGYRVTVTELAGWEHSLKNELILGKKVRARDEAARARLDALLAAAGVRPKLVRLLDQPHPGV